jgi:8-oxo-dGTP pyrophosphatase MutT (NUDIX family)
LRFGLDRLAPRSDSIPDVSASRAIDRMYREGATGADPVQAATVILLRDAPGGLETLMLRRNSKLAFVGGMWVFPGGRVDPADREGLAPDDELGAARRAAVREAREESGLEVEAGAMTPFSHWTPPPITPKRFLTWFFVAAAGEGQVEIDGGEIHDHAWMAPDEALRRRDALEIELAPPTWVTLHHLCSWSSVDEALAGARAQTPERYETRFVVTDGGPVAMWQGDAGYADSDPEAPGARHRLQMGDPPWRFERS